MPSRDLTVCCSIVQAGVALIREGYATFFPGLSLRPIQTIRMTIEQQHLYTEGRTTPGPGADAQNPLGRRVTNCDGVRNLSNHQEQDEHGEDACHACDLGVFDQFGHYLTSSLYYRPLKQLADAAGLVSGWSFSDVDEDHVDCSNHWGRVLPVTSNGSTLVAGGQFSPTVTPKGNQDEQEEGNQATGEAEAQEDTNAQGKVGEVLPN